MSKQRKRKYLQIVVTFLCICMLGGFSGKQVHAETGYALIPKVKEAQTVQSTLLKYDKSCTASKDYIALVDELLKEIM